MKTFSWCLDAGKPKTEQKLSKNSSSFNLPQVCNLRHICFEGKIGTQSHSVKFLNWGDHVNSVPDLAASPPPPPVPLHFEISRISLISISSDSLLYHLLLRQSSITVHVQRSTHLLFMISWCTFHSPEGFARRVPPSSIMIRWNKGLENHELKYGKGEENLSLSILKGLLLKCFEETRHMAISFTC